MKKLFTAIALASIIAAPAFATTIHHRAATPSLRQLYMYAPNVAPELQPNFNQPQQSRTYGPSSMSFNNQAWPGGRPSRY